MKVQTMDTLSLAPRDFSWKIRWRMKHDRNPLFIEVQDKYKVKAYTQERGVRAAELFYVTDKPETIPFDTLPENCFIKANHGCNWNILREKGDLYIFDDGSGISDSNKKSKLKISEQECIQYCETWLGQVYSRREWAYQHIPPRIIVEECLVQAGGEGDLKDYRFYVFNGVVKAISVGSPSYRMRHETVFLEPTWSPFKLGTYTDKIPDPFPEKPENLQDMIDVAQRLGRDLDFVRVDLFNTTRGITLGEMSIYPLSGGPLTGDAKFNQWMGDQWTLPRKV